MSSTLTSVRNQVELQLTDTSNYIWPEVTIDQAIRTTLAEISQIYGSILTLDGLDSATETTIEEQDIFALVMGAMVYCLAFRVSQRYEQASPAREDIFDLERAKDKNFEIYSDMKYRIKLRKLQQSTDHPHTQWEWDEGSGFS